MLNLGNGNKLNLMVHIAGNNSGLLRTIRGCSQAVNAFKRTLAAGSKSANELVNAGVGLKDMISLMRTAGKSQSSTYFEIMHRDLEKVKSSFRDVFRASRKFYEYNKRYSVDYGLLGPQKGVPKRLRPIEGQQMFNMRRVLNDNPIMDMRPLRFSETLGIRVNALKQGFIAAGHAVRNFTAGIAGRFPVAIAAVNGLALKIKEITTGIIKWGALMGTFIFGKFIKDSAGVYIENRKAVAQLEQLGLKGKKQKQMFKELKKVSKGYGISMTDLTQASVRFYSSGMKNPKKVAKQLKLIGDVALYSGQSFQDMGMVLTKALSGGYMDLTEFWQLNARGALTVQDLVGKLGNNIQEVMDSISKRKLTSELAIELMQKKAGGFHKRAKENLGVAAQYFQNSYRILQETFAQGMMESFGSEKAMATYIVNLSDKMVKNTRFLGQLFGRLVGLAAAFAKGLAEPHFILGKMVYNMIKLVTLGKNADDVLKAVLKTLGFIISSILIIRTIIKTTKTVVSGIQLVTSLATSKIGLILLATLAIVAAVIAIYKNWDAICAKYKWVKEFSDELCRVTKNIWVGIKEAFQDCWEYLKPAVLMLKDAFEDFGKQFIKTMIDLKPLWETLGLVIKEIVAVVIQWVQLQARLAQVELPLLIPVLQVIAGIIWGILKTVEYLLKGLSWVIDKCQKVHNWFKKINKGAELNKARWADNKLAWGYRTGDISAIRKVRGYASGGVVRVGERGGELISLPNGSTVIPHDYTYKLMNNNRPTLSPEIMDNIVNKAINKLIDTFGPKMDDTNIGIGRMNNGAILAV